MPKKIDEYELQNMNLFAIIIAIFSALSIISLFVTYSQEVEISKELFLKYNSTFPAESKTFEWAFSNFAPFSLIQLTILGSTTFLFVFALILIFQRKDLDGKQPIADLLIICIYFIFFFVFGILGDPIFLNQATNWV